MFTFTLNNRNTRYVSSVAFASLIAHIETYDPHTSFLCIQLNILFVHNEKEEMERTKGRNECTERQPIFIFSLHLMHANERTTNKYERKEHKKKKRTATLRQRTTTSPQVTLD